MARKPESVARQRGQALYADRVAKVAAFTRRKFPSYTNASAADKRAARVAADTIYGREDAKRKIDIKPIMSRHTSVVHLVRTAAEEKAARAKADAYNRPLMDAWKDMMAKWKAHASRAKANKQEVPPAPEAPTVAHHIRRVHSLAEMRQIKSDIGQRTPDDIRAVFIKQERLPTQDNTFSDGDVVRLHDGKWITLKGWQVVIFRAINEARYVVDPEGEEARVMAQLRKDFTAVAAHFKKTRGWTFRADATMFSPQVGRHQYYDALATEDRVHAQLAYWRSRYGHSESKAGSGKAPVTEWLEGINLILFLGEAGKRQHALAWGTQQKRRMQKRKVKKRHALFAAKKRERESVIAKAKAAAKRARAAAKKANAALKKALARAKRRRR